MYKKNGPSIDMDTLNAFPENDKACSFLEKAGIDHNPQRLALVEFALWAIENGCGHVEDATRETLFAMEDWSPVRLANFYLSDGNDRMLSQGWEDLDAAHDFAVFVLEDIERKVLEHFPGYFIYD